MSGNPCELFEQPACTACEPQRPATPLSLVNRPGLGVLRYRVGTFSTFRQAMLDVLVASPVASLDPDDPSQPPRTLTTGASDDYGVAMLELWAYVCDVLTLYQQAYANEAFLRTATLRESLARIAALLGYEPARGVAATARLAFFADVGQSVTVPAGLQLQSVPPPGGSAVTFETAAPAAITAANNSLTLLGPTRSATFVRSGELLAADAGAVATGLKVLFYDLDDGSVVEDVVTAVSPTPLGKLVTWRGTRPGHAVSDVSVAPYGRKFRWFGANAPASWLKPVLSGTTVTGWTSVSMSVDGSSFDSASSFSVAAAGPGGAVPLDSVYDGIAAGSRVLLATHEWNPSFLVARVLTVTQGSSARGPLSGSCTVLTIDQSMSQIDDLRSVTIYELVGDDLPFRTSTNGGVVDPLDPEAGRTIWVTDARAVQPGTQVLLVAPDGAGLKSDLVKVTAIGAAPPPPPYALTITPPVTHTYVPAETTVYANVAAATHGETQKEQVLGSGAAHEWQDFPLAVAPVTYVPDPAAERGAATTLRVFVDGVQWNEVPSFYGRGPDETVVTTSIDAAGKLHVGFGDGHTGRPAPTGAQNIRARLRKGLGEDGNVGAGTISVLMQTLPGLKSVVNPVPAVGGADPESRDAVRRNAPSSVVTLGRAVSLRDYEALALTYAGVAKAKAAWGDFGGRRGVLLTVAAAGGEPLDQLAGPLRDFLDHHRDPNVPLAIQQGTTVPFTFAATVHVRDGHKQSVVKAAAEAALGPGAGGTGYLDFERLQFGQTIFASALVAALQDAAGVAWVEVTDFSTSVPGHAFYADVAPPDAPTLEAVYIGPTEIAVPSVALSYADGFNDLGGA
jgi:phage-related baseplate assembly protein